MNGTQRVQQDQQHKEAYIGSIARDVYLGACLYAFLKFSLKHAELCERCKLIHVFAGEYGKTTITTGLSA